MQWVKQITLLINTTNLKSISHIISTTLIMLHNFTYSNFTRVVSFYLHHYNIFNIHVVDTGTGYWLFGICTTTGEGCIDQQTSDISTLYKADTFWLCVDHLTNINLNCITVLLVLMPQSTNIYLFILCSTQNTQSQPSTNYKQFYDWLYYIPRSVIHSLVNKNIP